LSLLAAREWQVMADSSSSSCDLGARDLLLELISNTPGLLFPSSSTGSRHVRHYSETVMTSSTRTDVIAAGVIASMSLRDILPMIVTSTVPNETT